MAPRSVRICQACGQEPTPCPTCGDLRCGDLRCGCRCYWAAGQRQHYDREGKPYTLNRRAADALAREAMA